MIEARCPWCGEKISTHKRARLLLNRDIYECCKCKRMYRRSSLNIVGLTIFMVSSFILLINPNNIISFSVFCGGLLIAMLSSYKSVCKRYDEENNAVEGMLKNITKPKDVEAIINWNDPKSGGLILSRLRITKGVILPICIVNENDYPLSHIWCIEVTKINPFKKQYTLRMRFLLDEGPEQLLNTNCYFYIYNNKKIIGRGKVTAI